MNRIMVVMLVPTVLLTSLPSTEALTTVFAEEKTEPPSSHLVAVNVTYSNGVWTEPTPHLVTPIVGTSYYESEKTPIPAQNAPEPTKIKKTVDTTSDIQKMARILVDGSWGDDQWDSFNWIVEKESGWNPQAYNKRSTACGLGQQDPCRGLNALSAHDQVAWVISYIQHRYTNPDKAKEHHLQYGWY